MVSLKSDSLRNVQSYFWCGEDCQMFLLSTIGLILYFIDKVPRRLLTYIYIILWKGKKTERIECMRKLSGQ